MKDIIITGRRQKIELGMLLLSFCLAMVMNIAAIAIYETEWKEIYTQWIWVLLLSAGFYVALVALRVLVAVSRRKPK